MTPDSQWFFEDIEAPKHIHVEDGIALWIRHVEWSNGPTTGAQGYVASLRTPGRVRNSGVLPKFRRALVLGKCELDKMIEQRK